MKGEISHVVGRWMYQYLDGEWNRQPITPDRISAKVPEDDERVRDLLDALTAMEMRAVRANAELRRNAVAEAEREREALAEACRTLERMVEEAREEAARLRTALEAADRLMAEHLPKGEARRYSEWRQSIRLASLLPPTVAPDGIPDPEP